MKKLKETIPMLEILKELKPYQRQIIIEHLDDGACESLQECLTTVLKKGQNSTYKKKISKCINENRKTFEHILAVKKNKKNQRKLLARVGGNPLGFILSAAVPLLLDLVLKKK